VDVAVQIDELLTTRIFAKNHGQCQINVGNECQKLCIRGIKKHVLYGKTRRTNNGVHCHDFSIQNYMRKNIGSLSLHIRMCSNTG